MEKYEIVGWIPARGGSKRLPRKNVRMLMGKPMVAWAIEACVGSKYISRTFVSTEDKEIKEVALKYGAEVIDRPAEFCTDTVDQQYALYHWKMELLKENYEPDFIVGLTPTSPMVTTRHIDEAVELYLKSKSMILASVCKTRIVPPDHYYINDSGLLVHCLSRQEIAHYNYRFASGYCKNDLEKDKDIYIGNSLVNITPYYTAVVPVGCNYVEPYIVSEADSVDVNTEFDLKLTEMLMKERAEREKKNKGG